MQKKKTYLFFPIEIGLAHMVRPFAIADELVAQGHRAIVAVPKRKQHIFKNSTSEIVDIETYIEDDFKINIAAFSDYQFMRKLVDQELALIQAYKPDAIIVDFRLSALAAGLITGCKVYSISNSDGLPYGSYYPNPGFHPLLHKILLPFIQKLYDWGTRYYLHPLYRIVKEHGTNITMDEWFRSVEYIIPEPKTYLPPVSKTLPLHYTGPLTWNKFENEIPSWLSDIEPDGKTIYLTFGGTGFDGPKLVDLAVALVREGFRVVVTSSTICSTADFPRMENLFVAKFLPGDVVSNSVDLVICHGGNGTTFDALKHQKPVIAVPFNPDQIMHSTRMEELGVARCLLKLNFKDVFHILTLQWKRIEEKGKNIPIHTVVTVAREILDNPKPYHEAIERLLKEYSSLDGTKEVVQLLLKK